eukprot:CAMPEP_0177155226 /NCGR_PEP_ID=MMETSP0367-20130122/2058_1 /TAXON_ID=447022 ORGANISM="Scrippsiella hangoei-like, Strain SHHI-4" /NCGR_SAMPLE_ID=MMETSP0367 /ASSEMBLY_ACC=CAM_ASM_000362 /LENGTH=210 /DNA_ID=CAMNT_0018600555 /DNA_START=210 /DNA_END=840 /DNA_ORIENTATION=+
MDKSMQPAARHGPKLCEAQAAIPIHVEFREHLRDLAQAVAPPTSLFRAVTKQCHAEVPRAYRTSLLEVKNLENLRNPLLVAVDIRRDQRREQQGVVDIAIFLTVEGGHKVPQLGQAHDVPQTTTAAEARRSPWRGAAEVDAKGDGPPMRLSEGVEEDPGVGVGVSSETPERLFTNNRMRPRKWKPERVVGVADPGEANEEAIGDGIVAAP